VLDKIPVPASQTLLMDEIDDLLKIVDDYQYRIFSSEGITEEQWKDDTWNLPRP